MSGPGFNLFLRFCEFEIGSFKVDKHNAPGVSHVEIILLLSVYDLQLFMFVCWTIIALSFMFCYFHLPTVKDDNSEIKNEKRNEMAEVSISAVHTLHVINTKRRDVGTEGSYKLSDINNDATSSEDEESLASASNASQKMTMVNKKSLSKKNKVCGRY